MSMPFESSVDRVSRGTLNTSNHLFEAEGLELVGRQGCEDHMHVIRHDDHTMEMHL